DPLPSWTAPYLMSDAEGEEGIRFILTFRPFGLIPPHVRASYLAGRVHIIPFPGSLLFWGAQDYLRLARRLPRALQIPLLNVCERSEGTMGVRIPQSGWMHEPAPGNALPRKNAHTWRNTYRRTHRWERLERHRDELAVRADEDRVAHVLFSTAPVDVDLYNKPMARNAQIWTHAYDLLLDGPTASRADLARASAALREGGEFGYRFYFPPMRVGRYEVFWHLPLVAWTDPKTGAPRVLDDAPAGYLTAYDASAPESDHPVELWPALAGRPHLVATMGGFGKRYEHAEHQDSLNAHKLIEVAEFLGGASLPAELAESILHIPRDGSAADWLRRLGRRKSAEARELSAALRRIVGGRGEETLPEPLTYHATATREFEKEYWETIAGLATGRFLNKENADCVDDPASRSLRAHPHRDLEALGDWLLAYYRKTIAASGMEGRAVAGDLPFRWETDFEFGWMGGWRSNQEGEGRERDLLVMIPGRDRTRAVIMADHYDTAYMEDLYYKESGGRLARVAAHGADDNHSATAALMLGAPVFMELSRAGRLECDIWLVHLTGEEFPADCMGARHLARQVAEKSLALRREDGGRVDLSHVAIDGVCVLDMVAHNRRPFRDVFQIAPGLSPRSYRLAYQGHIAARMWNAGAAVWNRLPARRGLNRGKRSRNGKTMPAIARHPRLRAEVRIPHDPRSALFNTDGQIFSDAGIPVILFMENYDINRTGYHDTKDTMVNIDLDYGAAVAAIAIETVARAAHSSTERTSL
ncbi:MAG TPA: M28 family peptidase, partial [Bacteroidota bacterium]|nr:M28 family peptidase [Bacteroidota bacterium]